MVLNDKYIKTSKLWDHISSGLLSLHLFLNIARGETRPEWYQINWALHLPFNASKFQPFTLIELYRSFNYIIKITSQCVYPFLTFSSILWLLYTFYFSHNPLCFYNFSSLSLFCFVSLSSHSGFSSCQEIMYPKILLWLLMLYFSDNTLIMSYSQV